MVNDSLKCCLLFKKAFNVVVWLRCFVFFLFLFCFCFVFVFFAN